tara:strand:+ start:2119 stop:3123 length:1005 start_codon:yes stop_codon:yes gene_type:complete
MLADIVLGLSYGDEGKGKVTHHLLKDGDYTHCLRFNGGCNAGHTIYHEGVKFVTHHIPAGVFFGIKSIIGPGCVVNLDQFFKELRELKEAGIDVENKVFIAKNTHIITNQHVAEDGNDYQIGTTKQGNGPAYRDKYNRRGQRAGDIPGLKEYVIDIFAEFHGNDETIILCEGAQGFGLDIDWGDYPFVTSSHCTAAGALLNGIPPQAVRRVYGVTKAYDTYVGAKGFHGKGRIFDLIQQVGEEVGATTGRARQCNWLNLKDLKMAIDVNGVTDLIVNKVDILRQVNKWNLRSYKNDSIFLQLGTEVGWKQYIQKYLQSEGNHVNITFSDSPERI